MAEIGMEGAVPEAAPSADRLKRNGIRLCLAGVFLVGYGTWLAWPPSVDSVDWDASDLEYLWGALRGFLALAAIPWVVGAWVGLAGIGLLRRRHWGPLALGTFSAGLQLAAWIGGGYCVGYALRHPLSTVIGFDTGLYFAILLGGLSFSACSLLQYAWRDEVRILCGCTGETVLPRCRRFLWSAAALAFAGAFVAVVLTGSAG